MTTRSKKYEMASMRQAEERAETVVLEPIMRVVVTAPKEYLGSVLGDISSRRGDVVKVQDEGGDKRVICRVPLAALPAYATAIRSLTSGRGEYTMEPEGYEPVPRELIEEN